MRKLNYIIFFVAAALIFCSCSKIKTDKDIILFGEIQNNTKPNLDSIFQAYDSIYKDKELNNEKSFCISVIQYAYHSRLDSVYSGIKKTLLSYGNKYNLTFKVAMGDQLMNATICKQVVSSNPNLIITLGTSSTQAVLKETKTIPVVFSVVTDPVYSGIAQSIYKPEGNKTGISDMDPFEQQIELIKLLKPDVKKVGIIVNSSESNCEAGMKIVRDALLRNHIKYQEVNATNSSEVAIAAKSLGASCDVFYISPSNTVYENIGVIQKIADRKDIIIIGGDKSSVSDNGVLCTYSYNFNLMGNNTAELAIRVLKYDINPGSIPVTRPSKLYFYINKSKAEKFGIEIPEKLIKLLKEN
jgi:putative tryptophan/tyrosine transport system substrate-binding protein